MNRPYYLIKGIRSKAPTAFLTSVLYHHSFKKPK